MTEPTLPPQAQLGRIRGDLLVVGVDTLDDEDFDPDVLWAAGSGVLVPSVNFLQWANLDGSVTVTYLQPLPFELLGDGSVATPSVVVADLVASGDTINEPNTSRKVGDKLAFTEVGSSTSVSRKTTYWVVAVTSSTFKISATQNGSAIVITPGITKVSVRTPETGQELWALANTGYSPDPAPWTTDWYYIVSKLVVRGINNDRPLPEYRLNVSPGVDGADLGRQMPIPASPGNAVIKGDPGLPATIDIAPTLTVDPSMPADVENLGTASAALLQFTIPKGEKGDPGPASVTFIDNGDGTWEASGAMVTDNSDGTFFVGA